MSILNVQSLGKSHGMKRLFADASFGVEERDRIGVIGPNGCGKSTLLRVIAGEEPPDEGSVTRRKDLRIEFLGQKPEFPAGRAALDCLLQGDNETLRLVREYERVSQRLEGAPGDPALLRRIEELTHGIDAVGGWEIEARARAVLGKLGIRDFDAPVETLSGGYRKRVALARALLTPSDLLILDEPTNHLDTDMIDWLEGYLQRFAGAVLLVTHDRYFLDRITRVIFDIDRGGLRRFEGNFSYYLERKAEIEESEASTNERRKNILRNELAWLKKGAKARTTKQKARIDRYYDLKAQVVERDDEKIAFESGARRLGGKILSLEGVSKSMGGKPCVAGLDYIMPKGERLGIVGPNGCGKTTLVNLITGRLAPDAGKVEIGETVVIGYYDQESSGLDPAERAIDYVKREGGEMLRSPDGSVATASAVMERFLFTPQAQYSPVGKLSGGEQRRLYLVRALMRDPNFLILDEPTNDLDIATLQALEEYLEGFAGCLIVISHDRYFLDRTVDCVMAFAGEGRWEKHPGGYEVYAATKAEREAAAREDGASAKGSARAAESAKPQAAVASAGAGAAAKLSYKEQKELDALEAELKKIEARLAEIQGKMGASSSDYAALQELSREQHELSEREEAAMTRWDELATRAAQAKKK